MDRELLIEIGVADIKELHGSHSTLLVGGKEMICVSITQKVLPLLYWVRL